MTRFKQSFDGQEGMGTIYSCLQALRRGEDSVDADAGMMLLSEFLLNVRGISSVFRKR